MVARSSWVGSLHPEPGARCFEPLKATGFLKLILDAIHLLDDGLTDEQISLLTGHGAVIGGMLDCWALDIRFIDAVSDPWQ